MKKEEKKKKEEEKDRLKRTRCEAEMQQAAADYQEDGTASEWSDIATVTRVLGGDEGGVLRDPTETDPICRY